MSRLYSGQEVRDTYQGRQLCEREEASPLASCTVPFITHVNQMLEPQSWVHGYVEKWLAAAHKAQSIARSQDKVVGVLMRERAQWRRGIQCLAVHHALGRVAKKLGVGRLYHRAVSELE